MHLWAYQKLSVWLEPLRLQLLQFFFSFYYRFVHYSACWIKVVSAGIKAVSKSAGKRKVDWENRQFKEEWGECKAFILPPTSAELEIAVIQARTCLKTGEQVGWVEFGVSLLLLSLCQTPMGNKPRRLFCDDSTGPWIGHQSTLLAVCFRAFFCLFFSPAYCLCLISVAPPPSQFLTEAFVSLQSSKGLVPPWMQFCRPGTNSSSAVPGTGSLSGWERLVLGGVDYVKPVGPQLQDRWSLQECAVELDQISYFITFLFWGVFYLSFFIRCQGACLSKCRFMLIHLCSTVLF